MARIIWSSSCAALRSSFDCSTILHPETGAQRPSGESLYRVHSAAMILCIARLKHQDCTYSVRSDPVWPLVRSHAVLTVRGFVPSVQYEVLHVLRTYVLLRIGKLS